MKNEMMAIAQDMVNNGYTLFNETVEEFVNRMAACGFTAADLNEWRSRFLAQKH